MASESVGLEAMFFVDGEKAQAVLSFGPSASLHPPTALCFSFAEWSQAVLSFGPSASLHPPTPDGAVPPAYGRGWPGSSGQHRLRPMHKSTVAIPCLPARSTHKPFAPLPLTSLAGTTNLSSCMGLSTIIRHGAIYHRAVWEHRLSHG